MLRTRAQLAVVLAVATGLTSAHEIGAQTATPTAKRDSAIVTIERSLWDNFIAGRWTGVTDILGGALTVDANAIYTWSGATTEAVHSGPCQITSTAMSEVQMREVTPDVVGLAYRGELGLKRGTATSSIVNRYLSIYRRRGAKWQLAVTSITRAAAPAKTP